MAQSLPPTPPPDEESIVEERRRHQTQEDMAAIVAVKEARKERARADAHRSVWFGLGMFGIVGWSVAVPALVFIAIGVWIDSTWPSRYSWTLMMMFIGVVLGCINAWYWVSRERSKMEL